MVKSEYNNIEEVGKMLNRYNLQIASFTEEETPYPSSLQFIKVTKEKTIATDGRKLIEVTRPTLPYDEYPDTGYEYKENRDFCGYQAYEPGDQYLFLLSFFLNS